MERVLVLYATREGYTRRVAEYVAKKLRARGVFPIVENVAQIPETIRLRDYNAAVLLASIHAGRHEREMIEFVRTHRSGLSGIRTAFLSVSLSEAGAEDPCRTEDQRSASLGDVQSLLDRFFEETGWTPGRVQPVAGALLYTRYNPFVRFVMKRIARKAMGPTDTSRDYEFTDWAALDRFAAEFTGSAPIGRAACGAIG